MGVFSRMGAVLSAKINALLDRSEDPAETLDYAYERQLEQLHKVKRGIVEVVTSKRRLEMQAAKLESNEAKLVDQAQRAVEAGREDLARIALQRKQLVVTQADGLRQQIQALEQDQERLALTEQKLVAKVENFRTRKEVIKAQYSAAEAQTRISETVSGLSEEMADVSLLVERAEERTESLQARALAIEPVVLILDDVLSAVDTETEARILQGLRDELEGRTAFIISHRVTAVKDADLILVLNEGRIVERGRHEDLLARGGTYASLLRRQLLEQDLAGAA